MVRIHPGPQSPVRRVAKVSGSNPDVPTMNVLFFSRLFYPHIGGVEKHVLEISKILIKKGHSVTIVTEGLVTKDIPVYLQLKKIIPFREKIDDIEIYRIPVGASAWFKKFKIWTWLYKHRSLISNANVIHCHDVFFWYLPFKFLYFNKKVFTTFHGYEGNSMPSKKAVFMHKLAEKLSFGNICVGDYLRKWYGTRPDYVTYGAVTLAKSQVRKSFNKDKIKACYIGRLEQEAGIIEYLKALKTLRYKGYQIELIVLGDGVQRQQAEKFCKINNLNVKFKGFVNDVYSYLYDSDFVFTSRFLSTLESLNVRKFPFVVYNNAIKKDCFEMSPFADFISLNSDEKSLASSFIYYFKNKILMYNKVKRGHKWVSKQTWEKLEKLYLNLWKKNE